MRTRVTFDFFFLLKVLAILSVAPLWVFEAQPSYGFVQRLRLIRQTLPLDSNIVALLRSETEIGVKVRVTDSGQDIYIFFGEHHLEFLNGVEEQDYHEKDAAAGAHPCLNSILAIYQFHVETLAIFVATAEFLA